MGAARAEKLDVAAVAKLGEWFNVNSQNADTANADLPQTTMGMANCLELLLPVMDLCLKYIFRISDVRAWQSGGASQQSVEKAIFGMFVDPAGQFLSSFYK